MCAAYPGNGSAQRASTIIATVAAVCGISPKVLLVMLQKEQSLITDTWPSARQYAAAMGAGCPDTAGCDPSQAGFFNQVYYAAWYLKRYAGPPGTGPGTPYTSTFNAYSKFSSYAPGAVFQIRLNPNPDCGTMPVHIRNQPTASLYTYTPYTPNAAALANLGDYGDGCSSYGNRNFWDYYYTWFGNPIGVTPTGVSTARVAGIDRFATAVEISKSLAAPGGSVVYIASGRNYPDALSAAPAAALQSGTLLLVEPDSVPPSFVAEIQRLAPSLIVVVGSEQAVSARVYDQLSGLAPSIRRDGGENRFDTSRIVTENAFPSSATAYIATGNGFPDALAASAAAGHRDAPVILVDGTATTVAPETLQLLTDLGVTRIIIAGSSVVVSDGVQASLATVPGATVTRLAGTNRFGTASALARDAFPTSATVYVAVSNNFPDALAGAVLAGSRGSALLLSPTPCMMRQTAQDIVDLKATSMVMLGSSAVLGSGVSSFLNCD
jgi:putative cell wall-binding protein